MSNASEQEKRKVGAPRTGPYAGHGTTLRGARQEFLPLVFPPPINPHPPPSPTPHLGHRSLKSPTFRRRVFPPIPYLA